MNAMWVSSQEETVNIRPLNYKKYNISGKRFKELYYFCLQYTEWKDELKYNSDTLKSIQVTDMPTGHDIGDPTQKLAIRRIQLEENCKLIEQTVLDTDKEIAVYLLKAITDENITYRYLKMVMGIPCSRNTYYERRHKFYWLLDKRKIL